ncbi:MAG TPA: hypothetical protein VEZ16_05495 [Microvirga sp.]|nr:hypothetical protein [Microvirga sp.]
MKAMLVDAKAASLRILALIAVPLASLTCSAQAATLSSEIVAQGNAVDVRFDAASRETRVSGRIAPGLCYSLSLPEEWRRHAGGEPASLQAVSLRARLDVGFRSAHDLQGLPQPDLAGRDAAFLQRDYEEFLGRPAQSVSLTSPAPGATRWSATWIDANLPTPSRSVTVEALIVPVSNEWVLELSLADVETKQVHDALIPRILSGLRVRTGEDCRE